MKPVGWYFARVVSGVSEESIRSDIAALPARLDHVDELIGEGVIGGEQPNAADFQIATSIRVLLNFPQLRPLIEDRPAEELAMRIAPRFGDPVPLKLPAEWVPAPALSRIDVGHSASGAELAASVALKALDQRCPWTNVGLRERLIVSSSAGQVIRGRPGSITDTEVITWLDASNPRPQMRGALWRCSQQ